ncbi:hypothetical protein BaRGS_00020778 [Batillaria attramentaria]|uniref:Uncharacterized protein n=1 Tax=Batillaria attramentaria TaxID=370345 RepID=A0ABD0KLC2_9CAEN
MSLDLDAKTHSVNYVGEAEGCYGAPTARCRRQTLEQDGKKAVVFTTLEVFLRRPTKLMGSVWRHRLSAAHTYNNDVSS